MLICVSRAYLGAFVHHAEHLFDLARLALGGPQQLAHVLVQPLTGLELAFFGLELFVFLFFFAQLLLVAALLDFLGLAFVGFVGLLVQGSSSFLHRDL